jgi:hypothetical protein
MAQLFKDLSRDAYRRLGLVGLVRLWVHALADLTISVSREHLAELDVDCSEKVTASGSGEERSGSVNWNTGVENHPFSERLAKVLDREPAYYQLLISTEPTRRMSDIIESLALEGDPEKPEITLELFQNLRRDLPELQMDRWLARLRSAAKRVYSSALPCASTSVTDVIMNRIYADPHLYELVAAAEPGYGLLDVVESLALEANIDEVEGMMALMDELSA